MSQTFTLLKDGQLIDLISSSIGGKARADISISTSSVKQDWERSCLV